MSKEQAVRVVSYAGFKGEERPVLFHHGDQEHLILEMVRTWVEDDASCGCGLRFCFQVRADDGRDYHLSYHLKKQEWFLKT